MRNDVGERRRAKGQVKRVRKFEIRNSNEIPMTKIPMTETPP
jgi:hypothetical protein